MALLFNIVTIFLLFIAGLALIATAKESGSSENKTHVKPTLSLGINENPFLKQITLTTEAVEYLGNPFLSPTPKPQEQLLNNDKGYQQTTPANNDLGEKKREIYFPEYSHNPFLQGGLNAPHNPVNLNKPDKIPTRVLEPGPIKENVETDTRRKSDLKCEEYGRLISGTTEVLSLVGTNSGPVKVNYDDCLNVNSLVVGGTAATPGEFPHMVALGMQTSDGSFNIICGGTLIAPEWVLSAAHCTYGPDKGPTDARIGLHNVQNSQRTITITITKIMRHPSYKPPAMYADIALLKLKTSVTFSREVRPACLYQLYDTLPTQAWVSGWGVTELAGEKSDVLQKALLDIIDNLTCTIRHNKSIAVPYGVTPSMICAGDPRGGWRKDTCQGDSGGPLQLVHPRNACLFQVVGITSFGEGCALIDKPGVYTRVSHYLNWIEDNVWPEA